MLAGLFIVLILTLSWVPLSSMADEDVFKCGQEITNKPLDASVCQKLVSSSAVQIEGTRVQTKPQVLPKVSPQMNASSVSQAEKGVGLAPEASSVVSKSEGPTAQSRHHQARTILEDEWQKLSAKHAELVRIYKHGRPDLVAGEEAGHSVYKQRVEGLQSSLQRLERDLQALRRELSRYPQN